MSVNLEDARLSKTLFVCIEELKLIYNWGLDCNKLLPNDCVSF